MGTAICLADIFIVAREMINLEPAAPYHNSNAFKINLLSFMEYNGFTINSIWITTRPLLATHNKNTRRLKFVLDRLYRFK